MPPPECDVPLHRYSLIDTTDPAAFQDMCTTVYGARDFEFHGIPGETRATINCMWLQKIDLGFMRFRGACGYAVSSALVRQQFPLRGAATTSICGRDFPIDPDSTCVTPIGADEVRHSFTPDYAEFRLRIEDGALRSKLGALIGRPAIGPIRFESSGDFANPELARLRRLVAHLISELDSPDSRLPELALAQYEQSLIVCFLTANRHEFTHLMEREAPQAARWQIRRAEDFFDAHSTLPVTIEALVEITGLDGRSIAGGFKRIRGITPQRFLRQIRLKHARRLLQMPDETTSVAAVAYRFGFGNAGRFAREYARTFGELPSSTLTNARRRRL